MSPHCWRCFLVCLTQLCPAGHQVEEPVLVVEKLFYNPFGALGEFLAEYLASRSARIGVNTRNAAAHGRKSRYIVTGSVQPGRR